MPSSVLKYNKICKAYYLLWYNQNSEVNNKGHNMSKLSIANIKNVKSLDYLNTFHINYQLASGKQKVWELVSRSGIERLQDEILNNASFSDGATIFATDPAKEHVVLIKEYRVAAGRYLYALPAGLIDQGETIEQAAIREFKEETGLTLQVAKVARERYTSVGLSNEKINLVYGYYSGTPSTAFVEETEDIEPLIVNRDQAIDILANKEVPIRTALLLESFFKIDQF